MRLLWTLCLALPLVAADPPAGLLGRWYTVVTTKDSIGVMYEFKPGGVVLIRPGAVVPGTFKLEGGDILLPPLVEGGPLNRQSLDFSQPGRLLLRQGDRISMDLSRVGKSPAGKPTVIGEWSGMRNMDGGKLEMRLIFYPNGKTLFLLPFSNNQAKYGVDKGRMYISLPDGKTSEGPFTLTGNSLSIPSVRAGASTKLARY